MYGNPTGSPTQSISWADSSCSQMKVARIMMLMMMSWIVPRRRHYPVKSVRAIGIPPHTGVVRAAWRDARCSAVWRPKRRSGKRNTRVAAMTRSSWCIRRRGGAMAWAPCCTRRRWCCRWRWTSTAFWCCSPNPAATGPMAASAASSFKEGWVWALVPWTAATLSPSRAPSTMHSGRSRLPTPIGRPCRGWMRLLTGRWISLSLSLSARPRARPLLGFALFFAAA